MARTPSRREFLKTAALTGAAVGLTGIGANLPRRIWAHDTIGEQMNVLVLGGTGQTGPLLIQELISQQHTVTMFNRGKRSAELFPEVECLIGDRGLDVPDGLAALEAAVAQGRSWDVCIDIWPQIPRMVENTALLLRPAVGHYMFVSSMSVYADDSTPDENESAAVLEAPEADEMEYKDELFGPFKAECENRVRRIYPDEHTIFRPGLIVGPRDSSFRGGYWPVRLQKGGETLAPGSGDDPVQFIDGRDLVIFQVLCMNSLIGGTMNVTGPHPMRPLTMRRYLEACQAVSESDADIVWADEEFLEQQEVGPWVDMPCWLPSDGEYAGFFRRNIDLALERGLGFRPLEVTIRDTLAWFDELPGERRAEVAQRVGLSPEREAEVLAVWNETQG
jgi:2'-hydroxyisoflavone reductase